MSEVFSTLTVWGGSMMEKRTPCLRSARVPSYKWMSLDLSKAASWESARPEHPEGQFQSKYCGAWKTGFS